MKKKINVLLKRFGEIKVMIDDQEIYNFKQKKCPIIPNERHFFQITGL